MSLPIALSLGNLCNWLSSKCACRNDGSFSYVSKALHNQSDGSLCWSSKILLRIIITFIVSQMEINNESPKDNFFLLGNLIHLFMKSAFYRLASGPHQPDDSARACVCTKICLMVSLLAK